MKRKKQKRNSKIKTLKTWNRDVAIVTFVAVFMLLSLTAFVGILVSGISDNISRLNNRIAELEEASHAVQIPEDQSCSLICSINRNITVDVQASTQPLCIGDKVKILAFYSPTCPFSESQRPVLESLKEEYGDSLNITYICKYIHQGDDQECSKQADKFDYGYSDGIALQKKYGVERDGTPVLIFDCGIKRLGSLAQRYGAEMEKEDLKKIIDELLKLNS